ncbi:hypothetical protein [Reichenbachiella ulvae]|uniref:Lipocalin-like domain-containing protein n=1 Tax=Reichenbachiella ulvae TaxID=2980104 RepID=A0ABT3CYW6_9BACT|nr:hypothetical protein [Reichenbachiella ulvae]MCV9388887.1 hypothetical protein [Reichenbachiella ulvae]
MTRLILLSLLAICLSCSSSNQVEDLYGLWQLKYVKIDKEPRDFTPHYLLIDSTGVFKVAKSSGDISGFYYVKDQQLKLVGKDNGWFNTQWHWMETNDRLYLKAKVNYKHYLSKVRPLERELNSALVFHRVERVEDNHEFEKDILGDWQLYKIQKEGHTEQVEHMQLSFSDQGQYAIYKDSLLLESGEVGIYSRYRSLFFSQGESLWQAYGKGDEMRLFNEEDDIRYWLRR